MRPLREIMPDDGPDFPPGPGPAERSARFFEEEGLMPDRSAMTNQIIAYVFDSELGNRNPLRTFEIRTRLDYLTAEELSRYYEAVQDNYPVAELLTQITNIDPAQQQTALTQEMIDEMVSGQRTGSPIPAEIQAAFGMGGDKNDDPYTLLAPDTITPRKATAAELTQTGQDRFAAAMRREPHQTASDLIIQEEIDALIDSGVCDIAGQYGVYKTEQIHLGILLANKIGSLDVNASSAKKALLHAAFSAIKNYGALKAAVKIFGYKDAADIQAAKSALAKAGVHFDDSIFETAILDLLERNERSHGRRFDRDAHRAGVVDLLAVPAAEQLVAAR